MSKKTTVASQKSAAKRNARAKAKAASAAKAKNTPMGQAKRKMRGLTIGGQNDFSDVLNQAVHQINKGDNVSGPAFKSTAEAMDGIIKAAGESFKLFCYNAVAKELIDEGAIRHTMKLDIEGVAAAMMDIDNRVSVLRAYMLSPECDEGVVSTEMLDIGTQIQNKSDEMYNEIIAMETHSLVVEDTINRLAAEQEEGSEHERRAKVLTAIGYKLLASVKLQLPLAEIEAMEQQEAEEAVKEETAE